MLAAEVERLLATCGTSFARPGLARPLAADPARGPLRLDQDDRSGHTKSKSQAH
jgi:hypothetical protein